MIEKYLVFNPLTAQYSYSVNKEEIAELVLKYALEFYYFHSHGEHCKTVYVDENGVEYNNPEADNGTELPEYLLKEALKSINERI
jgi:hypothetical protein